MTTAHCTGRHKYKPLSLEALDRYAVNVVPDHDLVSVVDWLRGEIQPIRCPEGTLVQCHGILTTQNHLLEACGDAAGRAILS